MGRHAHAGVIDGNRKRAVASHLGGDRDAAALGRELHRVREQVEQNLLDRSLIGIDVRNIAGNPVHKPYATALGAPTHQAQG